MEPYDFKLPSSSFSVPVRISNWFVLDGEWVEFEQTVLEIETDKAAFELPAPASGRIEIILQAGSEAESGDLIARIHKS
jgi:2-oxoglutarate dehydrogenase E2 component (dihydrolipoamide succinyltransferase)